MRHAELASIGHNLAHSLGSGIGLMIGVFEMDVFGEAQSSEEGFIEVDFLRGETSGGKASHKLADAVRRYAEALPELCTRHGVSPDVFDVLCARFIPDPAGGRIVVETKDVWGRRSRRVYSGWDAAAPVEVDRLGRIRRNRRST